MINFMKIKNKKKMKITRNTVSDTIVVNDSDKDSLKLVVSQETMNDKY